MSAEREIPDAPLSSMMATAVALNEWFNALLEAGFTEDQAIALICGSMIANPGEA